MNFCVWWEAGVKFIFLSMDPPVPFVEETCLSPLDWVGSFVKHQMIVKMQVCFCAPYPTLLIDLSVLMPVTLSVDYRGFIICLKVEWC